MPLYEPDFTKAALTDRLNEVEVFTLPREAICHDDFAQFELIMLQLTAVSVACLVHCRPILYGLLARW